MVRVASGDAFHVGQLDPLKRRQNRAFVAVRQVLCNLRFDSLCWIERPRRVLKDEPKAVAAQPTQLGARKREDILPVDQELSTLTRRIARQKTEDGQPEGALARPRLANDCNNLPPLEAEAGAV